MIEVVHSSGKRTAHFHTAQWKRITDKHKPVNGYYNGWKPLNPGETMDSIATGTNTNIPERLKVHEAGAKKNDAEAAKAKVNEVDFEKAVSEKAGKLHGELTAKINDLELEKEITKEEVEKLNAANQKLTEEIEDLRAINKEQSVELDKLKHAPKESHAPKKAEDKKKS